MKITARYAILLPLFTSFLTACGGGGGGGGDPASPPGLPTISVGNASIEEGDAGTVDLVFSVSLSGASTSVVTVDYSTADGSADAGDYQTASGQVSLNAGELTADVVVTVLGDTVIENDEDFTLGLTNPVNANLGQGVGVGEITNDDFPLLSIADAMLVEGDTGSAVMSFSVTLDQPGVSNITVDYASSDVTASVGSDYTQATGTLTIAAGDVSESVDIAVRGDVETESDEQLLVNLLNASSNVRVADDEAVGVIVNDDESKVSIKPAVVQEPDTGTTTVSLLVELNAPASEDIEVGFKTEDGSATAGADYTDASGTVVIPAGDIDAPVIVEIQGDIEIENPETIEVELTGVTGPATLGQMIAYATIIDNDDDPLLALSGSVGGVLEGDTGTTDMFVQFTLNKVATDATTISYSTGDGSAISPDDYTSSAGTAEIAAGETSVLVAVPIVGDTLDEGDENLFVNVDSVGSGAIISTPTLSGTIVDDDNEEATLPRLSARPAEVVEGDVGNTDLIFDVFLDEISSTIVTVDFATEGGSAIEGVDYLRAEGSLTFAPGELEKTVTVLVVGDEFSEDDEFLRLRLSNLTGDAAFQAASALGTIITDEPLTRLSVADVGAPEGDSGTTDQVFVVSLDVASVEVVTFDFATSDGTATQGEDYVFTSGSLQIPAGDLSASISVSINGDVTNEDDEFYTLTLSNVSTNAVVVKGQANGTIVNDDGTPGWQTSQSLGTGFQPAVALDDNGNGAIVFTGPLNATTFTSPVQITRIESTVWQTAIEYGAYTRSLFREPLVATVGGGEVVVTWGGNEGSVFYSPGAGWIEQEILVGGGFEPALGGNGTGSAILASTGDFGGVTVDSAWRSRFESAAGWTSAELAEFDDTGAAGRAKVAIDDAGNQFMVWSQSYSDSTLSGVYFDYYDASTDAWLGATRYSELPNVRNYNVAMLGDGRAALVVQMPNLSAPNEIFLFIYDPLSGFFLNSGAVGNRGSESEVLPEIAVDDSGNIFAVWAQLRSDGFYDAWSNRYDVLADEWGAPTPLETGDGDVRITDGAVSIAVDGAGNAIAAWSQATVSPNSDFRVRVSQYDLANDEWSPAEQIDDDARDGYPKWVRVAMDAAGNAVVVWEYDNANEIGAVRYVSP